MVLMMAVLKGLRRVAMKAASRVEMRVVLIRVVKLVAKSVA